MKLSQKYYLEWLENAYFVISVSSKKFSDLGINLSDLQQLKKFLNSQKFFDKQQVELVNEAIKTYQNQYFWAFRSIGDTIKTISFKDSFYFKSYPNSKNGIEKSMDDLYHRFPMNKDSQIDILAVSGEEICIDPRFGSGLSAGSMMNEVPSLISPKHWELSTGYQRGISLVKVKNDVTCYRFSFQLIKEILKNVGNLHMDFHIFMDEAKIKKYLVQQMNENIKDTNEPTNKE